MFQSSCERSLLATPKAPRATAAMASTTAQKRNKGTDYGPYGPYECPCYQYPQRTDRYYIFSVNLASANHRPAHWTVRGAALLASTDPLA